MIDRAGYQSKNSKTKLLFKFPSIFFTRQASPSGIYGTLLIPLILLTTKRKHYSGTFMFICVELQASLSSGPPLRVRKVQSCKADILICAYNVRYKFLIHTACFRLSVLWNERKRARKKLSRALPFFRSQLPRAWNRLLSTKLIYQKLLR